jgi:membrane fusion protein (multidrug efflux system)
MKKINMLTFIVAGSILSSCGNAVKNDVASIPEKFQTQVLEPRETELYVTYPATLEGEQTVEIRPKVDGYIEQVLVQEGAYVKKGQPIFSIDANTYKQDVNNRLAAIAAAEAELETAGIQVQRTKALVERKIVNAFELKTASNLERVKKAQLTQVQADLSAARTKLSYTRILSPIDGYIGTLPYKTGSLVSSTAEIPLTSVADTRKVYAYFSLSQQQLQVFLNKYKANQQLDRLKNMPEVTLILSQGETYPLKGKIETLSGVLNKNTGSANFKAVFANPDGRLWSGSSASVSVPLLVADALLIPKKSTYEIQGKRFVFKVDNQNKVQQMPIEIMDSATEKTYVVTSGLKKGDRIVCEGLQHLSNGMQIIPDGPTAK